MNDYAISIGLPAYNGEKYISAAIKSVLNQTFADFELIISDDNSRDKTQEICLVFAKKDPRIKYFSQPNNIGFLDNYNFVLSKAKTKYFIWLGQDDFWNKKLLETLYQLINKRKDAVLAMCNTTDVALSLKKAILLSEKYPGQSFTNKENRFESLKKFIKSGNLTYFYALYKTENIKVIGGYQKSSRPFFKSSDYMTIFRVLMRGPMVFTNEYLFFKRDTGNYLKDILIWKIWQ